MPEAVTLCLVLPPELGDPDQFRAELRRQVEAAEAAAAVERRRTGAGVLGRRAVLRQSWRDSPTSREPRRNLRPRIAACSQWSRIEALLRNRQFLVAYREAGRSAPPFEPSRRSPGPEPAPFSGRRGRITGVRAFMLDQAEQSPHDYGRVPLRREISVRVFVVYMSNAEPNFTK